MRKEVRVDWRQCNTSDTVPSIMRKHSGLTTFDKNSIILECSRRNVSEIKLKRTDTTLDLSQKAKEAWEKRKRRGESAAMARLKYSLCTQVLDPGNLLRLSGTSTTRFELCDWLVEIPHTWAS